MSEWDKESPAFLHFPGPIAGRPYAVIIPGGAFNRQWGLVEGMAIAAALNEMGYTAFVLSTAQSRTPSSPKPSKICTPAKADRGACRRI